MIKLALVFGSAVFAVFTIVFALVALLIGGVGALWTAPVLGLVVAFIWIGVAWSQGSSVVLDLCDVSPAEPEVQARLFNVVGGLCAAMGLPTPDLYVIDDPGMNALAVGRDDHRASIVVTQGLLDGTNLVELEAVIALEMFRIKAGDIGPETFVVPTIGASAVLSEAFEQWQAVSRLFALPTSWIETMLIRLHPARAELETDISAVQFTRYPPALAAGLSKMAGHSAVAVATPVTAHLWAAPPMAASSRPAIAKVHAPLPERIAVLQEL